MIWAVALTPDGGLLAAGGFSCKLRLFDTSSLAMLIEVSMSFFIWSVSFSADGRTLAVANWNKVAYRYRVEDSVHASQRSTYGMGHKQAKARKLLVTQQERSHPPSTSAFHAPRMAFHGLPPTFHGPSTGLLRTGLPLAFHWLPRPSLTFHWPFTSLLWPSTGLPLAFHWLSTGFPDLPLTFRGPSTDLPPPLHDLP